MGDLTYRFGSLQVNVSGDPAISAASPEEIDHLSKIIARKHDEIVQAAFFPPSIITSAGLQPRCTCGAITVIHKHNCPRFGEIVT